MYLDSLISFQIVSSFFSLPILQSRNEPVSTSSSHFILPPFLRNIFQKYRCPLICSSFAYACLDERLCLSSPSSHDSHAFQQLHFSVGSCSPRIQSYRRLVRVIISPFMILSQGSCIYVHASQFNGKHMLDRGRISEMCAIFFASCFTFALLFTVSRRDYERRYLNPFHSPWFQDISSIVPRTYHA